MRPEFIDGDVLAAYGLPADDDDVVIHTELLHRHDDLTSKERFG